MKQWIERRHGGQIWLLWLIGTAIVVGLVVGVDAAAQEARKTEVLRDIALAKLLDGSAASGEIAQREVREQYRGRLISYRTTFWLGLSAAVVLPLVLVGVTWAWLSARTGRHSVERWHWGKLVMLWGLGLIGILVAFDWANDTEGWSLFAWALAFAPVLVTTWIWLSARESGGEAGDEKR